MIPRPVLFLLFFGSGVAALTYEVVWIRALSLVLSITVYSLTTVLCSFMAGLGLGSLVGAVVADRSARPLWLFGWLEIGIGVTGVIVPTVLAQLAPAYVAIHGAFGGEGLLFGTARFLLAFTVLLVPSTLMGVTLPLLSRVAIDRPGVAGRGAGGLYAANTLGAVSGCVLAGFVLVPALGLQASSFVAAGVNLLVASAALLLGRQLLLPVLQQHEGAAPAPALSPQARLAVLAYAISGFTAMGYEVLWTRALEPYTHNSTYAYSAMLATFLLGLAIGSAVFAPLADRSAKPVLLLGRLQLGLGASVLLALLVYMGFETLVPWTAEAMGGLDSWSRVIALIFTEAGVTMLASTLLLGAMFPVVARVAVDSMARVGRRVGSVYVANTLGSILGSLCVGFGLLPWLGVRGAFTVLIAVNLLLAAWLCLAGSRGLQGRLTAAVAGVVLVALLVLVPEDLFRGQFEDRFGSLLFYREEVTDTVMVTEAENGSRVIRYADGRGTAGTATYVEDRMYAHIPMLLHPGAKRVLQIGFGVGNTLSSVAQHPIESAICVELSPGVIDAAPFFAESNRNVLSDPRVRLVVHDGRNYILTSDEEFDVIRMDPPELHTAGVVNLYTKEFLELARDHLAEGGIFSVWINNVMTPEDDIRMLLRTLRSVFPYVSLWHGPALYSWVMNASMQPHDPDLPRIEGHFADPEVRADLASIGIRDPFHFLDHYVMSGAELDAYAGEGPLVVDDHTRIDFTVPRSANAFYGVANFNTSYWLVEFMKGEVGDEVGGFFLRVVAERARRKTPVLPYVRNYEAAGYDRDELAARLREAGQPALGD